MSQARELTVRIVECIGANLKRHPQDVNAQNPIVIKVSRDDAAEPSQPGHPCRCHFELLEKVSQPKPYWSIKIEIENTFDFARFISGFDLRARRLVVFRHQSFSVSVKLRRSAAPPQFVSEPIHALPITNDNGHHVSC